MKTQKIILLGLMSALMVACGEKDPLTEYQNLNTAVPPYSDKDSNPEAKNQLFFIDVNNPSELSNPSQLSFVQGVEGEVQFSTRLTFSNSNEVKYVLKMVEGPENLGATFSQTGDTWTLKWRPNSNILTSTEHSRKIKLVLQFVLLPNSSPYVINQLKGNVDTREFVIVLNKDLSVPVVESEVQFKPSGTLNPNQQGTVQFVVAAKSSPENIQINIINGPENPSNELAQINANIGISQQPTRDKKVMGVDSLGRTRHLYKLTFDARTFVDKALVKIRENARLNGKFQNGELSKVEAVLYIEALNLYNGMRSAQKMVTLVVNLNEAAGVPLIAGKEVLTLNSGRQASQQFFVRASDARSEINIKSLQLGEEIVELKNGSAAIVNSGVSINLNCSAGTAGLNEQFNCRSGRCYESCEISAEADCETTNKKLALSINAESKMGSSIEEKSLSYTISINGKNNNCAMPVVVQGEK